MSLASYPSIHAVGHKYVLDIFSDPVLIEEKVDGSQFSFGVNSDGELICRSKGRELPIPTDDNLFKSAVNTALELKDKLVPGRIYRGEVISKPKHNTLCYGRTPAKNIIIFDIDDGLQNYLSYSDKVSEAMRLGLEIVPALYQGLVTSFEELKKLLELESYLGGTKIEGFVVKNYERMTFEKKVMLAKYVSEAFKEKHGTEWKKSNPGKHDVIENLVKIYSHENRWLKAVQHLRDQGELEGAPQDISRLLKEVAQDVLKEEREAIVDALFKYAWPKISRGITKGLPEWYKNLLASQSFEKQ